MSHLIYLTPQQAAVCVTRFCRTSVASTLLRIDSHEVPPALHGQVIAESQKGRVERDQRWREQDRTKRVIQSQCRQPVGQRTAERATN